MPKFRVFDLGGINTKISPFNKKDGELTRCVNMYTNEVGSKTKRPGYVTKNGTADGGTVNTLFQWIKEDNTTNYLYRASGSSLYYYDEGNGTGDWTLCANGTITNGNHVGHAVLGDTLILGDGAGSTRHTTSGTSFTDTTLAPVGEFFAEEFRRIYIGGTASYLFWSTTNDATNWQTSGTSDSSSIQIGGPGGINGVFSLNDRVNVTKYSGKMAQWDDYSLTTFPTNLAYTSPYSVVEYEGYRIGLNRQGFYGYGGGNFEILSNPVESQIFNNSGSAIAGNTFETAPAGRNHYMYQCAVGTITDDHTKQTVNDAVMVYNFQLNEWYNYQYANFPTSFLTYKNSSNQEKFAFGAANGQVYQVEGTATSDNGTPITSILEGFLHLGKPEWEKVWRDLWLFANPGCQATFQIAASDTFHPDTLEWSSVADLSPGAVQVNLSGKQRGRFLWYRIVDSSTTSPFTFYGFSGEADYIGEG